MNSIYVIISICITCLGATQIFVLKDDVFQIRDLIRNTTVTAPLSSLDVRTSTHHDSFYTFDENYGAFVQVSDTPTLTTAENISNLLCFDVDDRGFHSLEIVNGVFMVIDRFPNGSIQTTQPLVSQSPVLFNVCTLHNEELCTVNAERDLLCGSTAEAVPIEVLDIVSIDGHLCVFGMDNNQLVRHNMSSGTNIVQATHLFDEFLGPYNYDENIIMNLGEAGPYPVFDLLEEAIIESLASAASITSTTPSESRTSSITEQTTHTSSIGSTSAEVSSSSSTSPSTIVVLEITNVANLPPLVINLVIESEVITPIGFGSFNVVQSLTIAPGSTLHLDVSGIDIEDGESFTIFTFADMTGSFDNIVIDGWTSDCIELFAEIDQSGSDLTAVFGTRDSGLCSASTSITKLSFMISALN